MPRSLPKAAVGLLAVTLASCSSTAPSAPPSGAPSSAGGLKGELIVLAAASLTQTFTALGKQFKAAHPGITITLAYDGSATLAAQISHGAPGDVFASASTTNMQQAVQSGAASNPKTFARNIMQIATPPNNPALIGSVAALAKPGAKIDVCEPTQPCGVAAKKVVANAGLTINFVSYERDVKAVVAKVAAGEVDAGIVYATDVRAAGSKVHGIAIPAELNAATDYPIASLTHGDNPEAAAAFINYVLSDAGQARLHADGFATP